MRWVGIRSRNLLAKWIRTKVVASMAQRLLEHPKKSFGSHVHRPSFTRQPDQDPSSFRRRSSSSPKAKAARSHFKIYRSSVPDVSRARAETPEKPRHLPWPWNPPELVLSKAKEGLAPRAKHRDKVVAFGRTSSATAVPSEPAPERRSPDRRKGWAWMSLRRPSRRHVELSARHRWASHRHRAIPSQSHPTGHLCRYSSRACRTRRETWRCPHDARSQLGWRSRPRSWRSLQPATVETL